MYRLTIVAASLLSFRRPFTSESSENLLFPLGSCT
jgi:hypothetical protein